MVMTPEYIIDNKGRKTKVVLPIEDYQELLEDLHDLPVALERRDEKRISLERLERTLKKDGRL